MTFETTPYFSWQNRRRKRIYKGLLLTKIKRERNSDEKRIEINSSVSGGESLQTTYPKWIFASINIYVPRNKNIELALSENENKVLPEIAKDLWAIVMNTHSFFDPKEHYLGYVNAYLHPHEQIALTAKNENGKIKNIPCEVDKIKSEWTNGYHLIREYAVALASFNKDCIELSILPIRLDEPRKDGKVRQDKHSLEMLLQEFPVLEAANNLICERYNSSVNLHPTFYAVMNDQTPCIKMCDCLLEVSYRVIDRLYYSKINPILDKSVIGLQGSASTLKVIQMLLQQKSPNENQEKWQNEVKKLMNYSKEDLAVLVDKGGLDNFIDEHALIIDPINDKSRGEERYGRYCRTCNRTIPVNARTCPYCGHKYKD